MDTCVSGIRDTVITVVFKSHRNKMKLVFMVEFLTIHTLLRDATNRPCYGSTIGSMLYCNAMCNYAMFFL